MLYVYPFTHQPTHPCTDDHTTSRGQSCFVGKEPLVLWLQVERGATELFIGPCASQNARNTLAVGFGELEGIRLCQASPQGTDDASTDIIFHYHYGPV